MSDWQDLKGVSNEISKFKASLSRHLPAIEADVDRLIKQQSREKRSIEYILIPCYRWP